MLVMLHFFIAFRWIHLSTPLITLFPLMLILLLMPTLNFLHVWFALSLLRFRLPSRLFFFSSRRRHTRSLCDWSSDVCSSDLVRLRGFPAHCKLILGIGLVKPLQYRNICGVNFECAKRSRGENWAVIETDRKSVV